MSNFRKYPDRVLIDKDGNDLASTASNALAIEIKTPDGGSAMDDTADAVKVLLMTPDGGNPIDDTADAIKIIATASTVVIGRVRLVTATTAEVTDDAADAVKVLQVDSAGSAIATKNPTFSVLTASTAAVAFATNPAGAYRLLRVEAKMSAAATAAENFTVTIDAGDGDAYDSLIHTVAASALATPNVVKTFGNGYEYETDDDIDIAFTNSEARTVSVRVVYELL